MNQREAKRQAWALVWFMIDDHLANVFWTTGDEADDIRICEALRDVQRTCARRSTDEALAWRPAGEKPEEG